MASRALASVNCDGGRSTHYIGTSVTDYADYDANPDAEPIYGGTVTGGGQVTKGGDKTISITPDAGWYISSIRVGDVLTALDTLDSSGPTLNKANSYTLSDIQADHSVEVTFKKIFFMMPGASIRLANQSALRFGAEVSAEFLADLDDKDVTYNLGTLILPENLIPSGDELTLTTEKVKNIPQTIWQDSYFAHAEGHKVMTGVITDIPFDNY